MWPLEERFLWSCWPDAEGQGHRRGKEVMWIDADNKGCGFGGRKEG